MPILWSYSDPAVVLVSAQVDIERHMLRTRYYIAPRMHRLLSAVAASRQHTITFHCNTASVHTSVLHGYMVGGIPVVPAAALLDLGCEAAFALSERDTSTSLTHAVLPKLQPTGDLPPVLALAVEAGAMEVTEAPSRAALFRAAVSRLHCPPAPTAGGPQAQQRVTTLERIIRAGFGAAWAARQRMAALTCVDSPASEQADGFVTHPTVLASAIAAADAAEDASAGVGMAFAVTSLVAGPPAGKDAGSRLWAAGDPSGRSHLTQASMTIAALEVLPHSLCAISGRLFLSSVPVIDSRWRRWTWHRLRSAGSGKPSWAVCCRVCKAGSCIWRRWRRVRPGRQRTRSWCTRCSGRRPTRSATPWRRWRCQVACCAQKQH